MRANATCPAVLALTLLAAAAPFGLASAQPFGREASERAHDRNEARREDRRDGEARRRADAYAPAPPPAYAYPQRPPAPAYSTAPPPAYTPAQTYPAPPAYAPNSLGAGWGQQQDAARRGVRQGALMPLRDVMTRIRRGTPGRLLDAGLEPGPGGRPAYRVRWAATNGRRIDFIVDAATGAIIRSNGY